MQKNLPDPAVFEQLLSAIDKHPMAALLVILFTAVVIFGKRKPAGASLKG